MAISPAARPRLTGERSPASPDETVRRPGQEPRAAVPGRGGGHHRAAAETLKEVHT
ncbi:MAG: hypothetical protein KatS3mg060_2265 [Dehalococcoidia bacterium]|nr:MAG: hypothetical protein KatS3mg060_2265 [Dehalococcoidia bacterium]